MTIINLADHYSVWTKSTIIELLEALGDSDFQRSQSKPELIECLHNYFVPDVLSVTELKSLSQLAVAVGIELKGKKNRRERFRIQLIEFQQSMKEQALALIQDASEEDANFMDYVRLIMSTDPELAEQLVQAMDTE
jgi:hypothetical protein